MVRSKVLGDRAVIIIAQFETYHTLVCRCILGRCFGCICCWFGHATVLL